MALRPSTNRRSGLTGGLALSLVVALNAPDSVQAAPAEARRVAILPVELDGESERARATVLEQLRAGLRRGPFELVEAPATIPTPCKPVQCEQDVAGQTGASFVIRPRVSQQDNVYTVTLEARDAGGELVGAAEDVCEICGLKELGDLVAARSASLSKQLETIAEAPPVVALSSDPAGAEVWIDERFVGRTPLQLELDAGRHEVRFEARGYVPQTRSLEAIRGVREDVSVTLGRARVDRKARALAIGGGVGLGVGVALAGAGIPLIAIDGRPFRNPCNPDPEGNCENLHDTLALGAGLTAVGAAALVTGAALLAVGLRRRGPNRLSVTPSGVLVRW